MDLRGSHELWRWEVRSALLLGEKPRRTGRHRASQEGPCPDVGWAERSLRRQPRHLTGCVTLHLLLKLSEQGKWRRGNCFPGL